MDHKMDYQSFLESSKEIIDNSFLGYSTKLIDLYALYVNHLNGLLTDQSQIFPSFLSKIIYLNKKYGLNDDFIKSNIALVKQVKRLINNSSSKLDELKYINFIDIIRTYVNLLHNNNIEIQPPELIEFDDFEDDDQQSKDFFNLQVIGKKAIDDFINLYCLSVSNQQIILTIKNHLLYLDKLFWKNSLINALNFDFKENNQYISNDLSQIILNPNYLMDVTELAECFNLNKSNYYLYFIKKFEIRKTNPKAILGNLVNYCFDELIIDNTVVYDELFRNFIKIRPLVLFSIFHKSKEDYNIIKNEGELIFNKLKKTLKKINLNNYHIEPTFISSRFGIQGRLDLLLESSSDLNEKNIVELKSGKVPGVDYGIAFENKMSFNTGMWINHYAQVIGYIMLLESTYVNRKGYSAILYANDDYNPYRNAPDNLRIREDIIELRNTVLSIENAILSYNFSILNSLNTNTIKNLPKFINEHILHFEKVYSNLSIIEKDYFHFFYYFILKENYIGKIGDNNSNGFSELWLSHTNILNVNSNHISNAKLLIELSELTSLYIYFEVNFDNIRSHSLRKGDPVIIYKNFDEYSSPLRDKINKGTIKAIDDHSIIISLRNKQTDMSIFEDESTWNIAPDLMDTSTKYAYQSIFKLLSKTPDKKNVILGLNAPKSTTINVLEINSFITDKCLHLNQYQVKSVKDSLMAEDYYLIQGPPGTGKTSYVISSIANYYYFNSDKTIVLLAYTNRAVDGLCETLNKSNVDFIRIGSKEVTEFPEYSFFNLAETIELKDLYKKLINTRVFVSTVTSFQTNSEISDIKKFDVAIIDEASQILEPHLVGILSDIDKFILVGDERQLPAVVIQDKPNINIDNLKEIELLDLTESYFSRILRICKKNNWENAFSSLVFQGRMHIDIQDIANIMFYDGILKADDKNVRQYSTKSFLSFQNDNLSKLFQNRVIFVNTPIDKNQKTNKFEVDLISKITQLIKWDNPINNNSIGVISPFKSQCSLIQNNLNYDLKETISVDTIERFQGAERDIIFLSLSTNSSFFLSRITSQILIDDKIIDRKLNVSITRAKEYCIILGNREILSKDSVYQKLINYIEKYHLLINFEELKIILDNVEKIV